MEAERVAVVDPAAVFDFDRDALLAHRQHEVDFGFGVPFGEVRHVQADQGAEEVPHDTLGDVTREIVQMR